MAGWLKLAVQNGVGMIPKVSPHQAFLVEDGTMASQVFASFAVDGTAIIPPRQCRWVLNHGLFFSLWELSVRINMFTTAFVRPFEAFIEWLLCRTMASGILQGSDF